MKKTTAQSMSVSEEEKLAIEVLALAERMKPAAFVRAMFYRGMHHYLRDREPHAPETDEEIYSEIVKLINESPALLRVKRVVEERRQLSGTVKEPKMDRREESEQSEDETNGQNGPLRRTA